MKKLTVVAFVGVVSVLGVVSLASAGTAIKPPLNFTAALNAGQEIPHAKGTQNGASGRFTATITGTTMKWKLTFAHLSGAAKAAHIHSGLRGKSGPVLVPLCGPCTSGVSGSATITSAQLAAMTAGKDYVNVHTAKNPGGEIRGQITAAPATPTQTTAAPATPAQTTEVTVSMFEMGFKLSTTVVPHGTVIFNVKNDGVVPHDFRIGSQATETLDSGQSETLTVTLSKPGQFTFLCTVSGHAGAGMIGALTVK